MHACLQTVYLPVIGLVEPKDLSPGDLVGVHKDSYLILEKLPDECVFKILSRLPFTNIPYRIIHTYEYEHTRARITLDMTLV